MGGKLSPALLRAQEGCQTRAGRANRTCLFSTACRMNTFGYSVCGARDCRVAVNQGQTHLFVHSIE